MKIFYAEEYPYATGKFMIRVNHDFFRLKNTSGSFNIICARVFGLSYADYLRFVRDIYGAELIGKNEKYPLALFGKSSKVEELIMELNRRAALILEKCNEVDIRTNKSS